MPKLARYMFAVDDDGSVTARRVTLVQSFPDFPDVHYQTLPVTRTPQWVQDAVKAVESVAAAELARKTKK